MIKLYEYSVIRSNEKIKEIKERKQLGNKQNILI